MELYIAYISDMTENDYNEYFTFLSEERKSAVLRMRSENDRKRSVLGEMLARRGIAKRLGICEREIAFKRSEKGKPFCTDASVCFSISHSKNAVACVIDSDPIGLDIEKMRDIDLRITRIACTDSDKEYILGSEDENLRFFKVWTAKEAYFKYLGTGIESLKTVSYADIRKHCRTEIFGGYMLTVYSESGRNYTLK